MSPMNQTRKDPFQLYSPFPIHLSLNSQQGPTLSDVNHLYKNFLPNLNNHGFYYWVRLAEAGHYIYLHYVHCV
jgi:hypothetical protein